MLQLELLGPTDPSPAAMQLQLQLDSANPAARAPLATLQVDWLQVDWL